MRNRTKTGFGTIGGTIRSTKKKHIKKKVVVTSASLLGTSASLLVTSALLVVTMLATRKRRSPLCVVCASLRKMIGDATRDQDQRTRPYARGFWRNRMLKPPRVDGLAMCMERPGPS